MSVLHVSFLIKMFTSSELVLKGSAAGRLEQSRRKVKELCKEPMAQKFLSQDNLDCLSF